MRYVIYRDDYDYPINGSTLEEMREKCSRGNFSFIRHYYGSVAYDRENKNYVDIYTGKIVPASERSW